MRNIFRRFQHRWVIFSIKDELSPRHKNVLMNLMQQLQIEVLPLVWYYKGQIESSWLVSAEGLDRFCSEYPHWAKDQILSQESFLLVTSCNKKYASLVYNPDHATDARTEFIGHMQQVTEEDTMALDGWTYRPDTGQYFACLMKNPDRTPPAMGWPSKQARAVIEQRLKHLDNAIVIANWACDPYTTDGLREVRDWIKQQYLGEGA